MKFSNVVTEFVKERLKHESNNTQIAREVLATFGIDLNQEAVRNQISRLRTKLAIHPDIDTSETDTETNQYAEKSVMSAFDNNNKVMDIDAYCLHYGLPRDTVRSYKLVTHTGTPYYNIAFHEHLEETNFLTDEFFDETVKKFIKPVEYIKPEIVNDKLILRAVYTDTHIGMTTDKEGIALYSQLWDKTEQIFRFKQFVDKIVSLGEQFKATELIIDDLGDYMDGWNAQTVRGGHDLPQNMTNEQMFDTGVMLKVMVCDMLIASGKFTSIKFNNICNDNHAGSFGYVVNSAVKSILETKYINVTVINYKKFINHYVIGKHTFVITHGKDKESLKFGFKPHLDANGAIKIANYIRENTLDGFIEFSKGDSHQLLFDYATSDNFDYMNYGAMSPSSQWVQTNFQKGRSSFVIQIFDKDKKDKMVLPTTF